MALLTDALWDTASSLCDADAERLVDLLVLALVDALAILPLCEADSDAALSDCDCTVDRLSDADVLALADSEAS